jgi:hypothetical protein
MVAGGFTNLERLGSVPVRTTTDDNSDHGRIQLGLGCLDVLPIRKATDTLERFRFAASTRPSVANSARRDASAFGNGPSHSRGSGAVIEQPRTSDDTASNPFLPFNFARAKSTVPLRQHNDSVGDEQNAISGSGAEQPGGGDSPGMRVAEHSGVIDSRQRGFEYNSRRPIEVHRQARLGTQPGGVPSTSGDLGSVYDRSVRDVEERQTAEIQFGDVRPGNSSGQRVRAELEMGSRQRADAREQLLEPAVRLDARDAAADNSTTSQRYAHSTVVAPTHVVQNSETTGRRKHRATIANRFISTGFVWKPDSAGEATLADIRMEDLVRLGAPADWSDDEKELLNYGKTKRVGNKRSYASSLKQFFVWLLKEKRAIPPTSKDAVKYMKYRASSSESGRPASGLKQLKCAYRIYAKAYKVENIFDASEVNNFMSKVIQKFTTKPLQLVKAFNEELQTLFDHLDRTFVPLDIMDLRELRNRTILLLSLAAMTRPSDIAGFTFCRNWIEFGIQQFKEGFEKTFVKIELLATKTDFAMMGRKVRIYGLQIESTARCPVEHLNQYLTRTSHLEQDFVHDASVQHEVQPNLVPVFLTTVGKLKGLVADTISSCIRDTLQLAGIQATAKSMRTTAATKANDAGASLGSILQTGGWSKNSKRLLQRHYLRPSRKTNISAQIFEDEEAEQDLALEEALELDQSSSTSDEDS